MNKFKTISFSKIKSSLDKKINDDLNKPIDDFSLELILGESVKIYTKKIYTDTTDKYFTVRFKV